MRKPIRYMCGCCDKWVAYSTVLKHNKLTLKIEEMKIREVFKEILKYAQQLENEKSGE